MKYFYLILIISNSLSSLSQDTIRLPQGLFPFFENCIETKNELIPVQDMLGRVHFLKNKNWELKDSNNVNFNYFIKHRFTKAPTEFRVKFLASKNLKEITQEIQETTKEKGKSIEQITINGIESIIVHDSTNYACCGFPFFVKSLFVPLGKDLVVFNFSCQNKIKKECLCQFKEIINSIYLIPTLDLEDTINLPPIKYTITNNQEIRNLNKGIKNKLDSLTPYLLKNPNIMLDIGVHYTNKKYPSLSTRGAMALAFSIKYYLEDQGVKNTLIPVSYGDSEPIHPTLFSPLNNRIEFKVLRK